MEKVICNKVTFVAHYIGDDPLPEEVDCTHVVILERSRDVSVTADGLTGVRASGGKLRVMLDSKPVVPRLENPCEVRFVDDAGKEWSFRGRMIAGDVFQFAGS